MFSQLLPDSLLNGLSQAGILGAVIAVLFWRDFRRDEKLDRLTESLNHLTRALTLEVLSRPTAITRAQDEARELQNAIDRKE